MRVLATVLNLSEHQCKLCNQFRSPPRAIILESSAPLAPVVTALVEARRASVDFNVAVRAYRLHGRTQT